MNFPINVEVCGNERVLVNTTHPAINLIRIARYEQTELGEQSFRIEGKVLNESFYSTSTNCPIVDLELVEFKENFDEYWPYSKTDIWQEQDTRDVLISTPDIFEKVLYLNVSTL